MTTQSDPGTNPAAPSGKPACADIPPVDAIGEPHTLKPKKDALPLDGEQPKTITWGTIYVGNCSLSNGSINVRPDGSIFFSFGISSDGYFGNDAWVFYKGISLVDIDGNTLWTSAKISSQTCPPTPETETWSGFLDYPAVHFDAVWNARINKAHC